MPKVASYRVYYNSTIKDGVTKIVFELSALKAKIKGVLASHAVAMVTCYASKLTQTCSPMTGQSLYTDTECI